MINHVDEFIRDFNRKVIENACDINWVSYESEVYDESDILNYADFSEEMGVVERVDMILSLKPEYKNFNIGPYIVLIDEDIADKHINNYLKETFGDIEAMIGD